MTDISHDLRSLRHLVDSPLSSKVAMFNNQVQQHQKSQLLNPFSQIDGRASPKPTFTKDEYGKPLAGSLTEMRGNKANIHVLKEMLELCQIIDSEGYAVKDEPKMRVIPFGELFNIYNYISDKVVGILLRARKHKLVEFEGEMLYQRRDDNVPIFLLKPVAEIRKELDEKVENIKRAASPAPQATTILLERRAMGLEGPRGATPVSRSPSPAPPSISNGKQSTPVGSKASSPTPSSQQKPNSLPKLITSAGGVCNQDGGIISKPPLPTSTPGTPKGNESYVQIALPANHEKVFNCNGNNIEAHEAGHENIDEHDSATPNKVSTELEHIDNNNNNNINLPVILIEDNTPKLEAYLNCETLNINENGNTEDKANNQTEILSH